MIAVIDYGMGNLRSVHKAFEAVGYRTVVTRDPKLIKDASHLVLPGVGAFGDCMDNLDRYDLISPIRDAVSQGKPFLGICLGLQVLFTESEEFGRHRGLGLFKGRVRRFPQVGPQGEPLKIPHMGWNTITIQRPTPLLEGIDSGSFMYFVHSYYVEPQESMVAATTTDYGITFVSSVWRENVFAAQFHPEKSQRIGLQVLRNFGAWT